MTDQDAIVDLENMIFHEPKLKIKNKKESINMDKSTNLEIEIDRDYKMRKAVWAAQSRMCLSQAFNGNVTVESVLGEKEKIRIEKYIDKLDTAGIMY